MLLLYATALLAVFLVGLVIYARWNYGSLEAVGIPVIPPAFIFGSDPAVYKNIVHIEDYNRFKKYGPVWGLYEGRSPQVFIADAEIARQILIKDFESFQNRRNMDFGHELLNEMMDIMPYDKWKVLRHDFTPAFTTGKIRAMSGAIEDAVKDCVAHIDMQVGKESSKVLDQKKIYVALTTDVIARCVFGTKLNDVNSPDNDFVKNTSDLVGDSEDPPCYFSAVMTFPILSKASPLFPVKSLDFFGGVLKRILAERRRSKVTQNDMVDSLNELMARVDTPQFKSLGITETTVLSNAIIFLFAGFETTATTLTMLGYYLSLNPDKQQKLIAELDELLKKDGKITHDNLAELPYMNATISETLRHLAPLARVERVCNKDWKHPESDLVIKEGWTVFFPSRALNMNEKYWPNPEEFIPERFLPENKDKLNPYAYMSFGQGPRNCIGMRFAKEELLFSLALILKDFTFEPTDETKVKFKPGRMFLAQFEPVKVKFVRRQK